VNIQVSAVLDEKARVANSAKSGEQCHVTVWRWLINYECDQELPLHA